MAEAFMEIAQCKLRGMNQRVGLVYDDVTLRVLGIRAIGRGIGTLKIKYRIKGDTGIFADRLAHKADNFTFADLAAKRLVLEKDENGELKPPLKFGVMWIT